MTKLTVEQVKQMRTRLSGNVAVLCDAYLELVEAARWALQEPQGHSLHPWQGWLQEATQEEGWRCWGCSGEFVSTWPKWEKPTNDTFPHEATCRYVALVRAALPAEAPHAD